MSHPDFHSYRIVPLFLFLLISIGHAPTFHANSILGCPNIIHFWCNLINLFASGILLNPLPCMLPVLTLWLYGDFRSPSEKWFWEACSHIFCVTLWPTFGSSQLRHITLFFKFLIQTIRILNFWWPFRPKINIIVTI